MMTPQILESANFTKTQKSRCLEQKFIFSSNKKIKLLISHQGLLNSKKKKSFLAEVTFRCCKQCFEPQMSVNVF